MRRLPPSAATILQVLESALGGWWLSSDPCPSALSIQPLALRSALLDFISDFANWDKSTAKEQRKRITYKR
ncbi:MAG: hypothetical protein WCT12_34660 [Verrucomicrobiota bacterium]